MSPKRLFDEPAEERSRAPGPRVQITPPPQPAGLCGLAVCLQSALGDVSYARLMGLLNTAFMLHVERGFPLAGTELAALRRLQRAQPGGDDTQPWLLPGDDATDVIETELLAGSAPVARECSTEHGGWVVICGLDTQTGQWSGYRPDSGGRLVTAPVQFAVLVRTSSHLGLRSDAHGCTEAMARAADLPGSDADPTSAYERWADLMLSGSPFDEGPPGDEAIARHELLVRTLLDARQAAVEFCEQVGLEVDEQRAELLTEVADLYMQVGDAIEARQPAIFDPLAGPALRQPEVRAEWAEILLECARIEREALELMGRAGTTN